jgi:hypothetical protein
MYNVSIVEPRLSTQLVENGCTYCEKYLRYGFP